MAYGRSRRRSYSKSRKRTYRRRRRNYRSRRRYNRTSRSMIKGTIIADTTLLKFPYSGDNRMLASTGTLDIFYISGNSLYDPEYTSGGTQPQGFDQWSAFYNYYTVTGSSIDLRLSLPVGATAGTQNVKLCMFPISSSFDFSFITSALDIEELARFPYAQIRMGNIVGGSASFHLKAYMPTHKIEGISRQKVLIDDSYSGDMASTALIQGSSPANDWFWVVAIQATDDASTIDGRIFYRLKYYTKLYSRKALGQS